MNELSSYEVMSFDCYGTLIEWERGIVDALLPVLQKHGVTVSDEEILHVFAKLETVAQRPPYKRYFDVLKIVGEGIARELGCVFSQQELDNFAASVGDWPPFPDSVESLSRLGQHYDLVILSNVDDDLFLKSSEHLQTRFEDVITAEQVGSYKPDQRNFETLLSRVGKPQSSILHVAQSLYHDIAPASSIGLSTVWVNRRSGRPGAGATPPQEATPDVEVPSLAALATMVEEVFQ